VLYLVATPIGNLGDMPARGIEALNAVDLVLAEDTRKTGILLKHFGVAARQMPFHDHNERHKGDKVVKLLEQGKDVALVTDGGTPGISDPGFSLVRAAIERGIPITMVPGPTAFVMALVLSGLPVHSFTFRGFPPRKGGQRRRFYEADAASPYTLIYYESPYRLVESLHDALAVLGDRPAALANDLTKRFEAVWRAPLAELAARVAAEEKLLGEYVLVVAGLDDPAARRRTDVEESDAGERSAAGRDGQRQPRALDRKREPGAKRRGREFADLGREREPGATARERGTGAPARVRRSGAPIGEPEGLAPSEEKRAGERVQRDA
jgi:16S rRNA (cytidine1402-2'-O)-methyltransferase